jgi:hypothetical protein
MDKSSVLGGALGSYLDHAIAGPFLCGKEMGAYEAGEDFITRPQTAAGGGGGEAVTTEIDPDDEDALIQEDVRRWEDIENLEQEMGNSWWWNECQVKFLEDRRTWGRIKESMARGCCRVVLRVEEGTQHARKRGVVDGVGRARRPEMSIGTGQMPMVGVVGMESDI